ncbi:hypothetical protein C1H57_12435 [Clostridium sp. 2-1]|uniref:hypothetical protein n=1 Tax=Clostridium TaxID=1485 RepID=UPI000CDA8C83|nr:MULTISPECIES: hypothetical protein [Clostridium]MBN7576026.1 hypothetical protein [Clostridium beijerinckii]MBN7581141.1 hypothetical protein [Clostridium beijerinckii]MBN7585747.1 hypothetical protein [Clostridium beijerinckii]MBO0521536.1 hypothetical protein [Clostridium beijerinckii]POO90991.1 hypothetical protein C1H57_12435 [Clostridium sp. 2-1]
MGWKIPDKITAIPQDNDLVPFDQGGILRKSTWQKIKEYMIGAATLKTTSQEVIGAVNELKETSDSHTTELENINADLSDIAINLNAKYPRLAGETSDYNRIARAIADVPLNSNLLIPNGNYDLGGNTVSINRNINIIGESRPVFDAVNNVFLAGAIFNNKVFVESNNVHVKNIGVNASTVDQGFQNNTCATQDVVIEDCITNVSAHGYLIESYNGLVENTKIINCESYNSIHGFISKATNTKLINCRAYNHTSFCFGFISDNIQGASKIANSINNIAINCEAFDSGFSFICYSRDMFSDTNTNNINMQYLTLISCKTTGCSHGFTFGDTGTAPSGNTYNQVFDVECYGCAQMNPSSVPASAIDFRRCNRVKFYGTLTDAITYDSEILAVNLDLEITSERQDFGHIQDLQIINDNLSIPRLWFKYAFENTYKIQNTVATTINGFLGGSADKSKSIKIIIDDDYTKIVEGTNISMTRNFLSGKGSWIKFRCDGAKWVEESSYQIPMQYQQNISTDGGALDVTKGIFIDCLVTATTSNKISLPNVIPEGFKVTTLVRATGTYNYGGFDTTNLINNPNIVTNLAFSTPQLIEWTYVSTLNKWICTNLINTKIV